MSHTLFYTEIVRKISDHFFANPDHINMIAHRMNDEGETIWQVCSEGADIFTSIQRHCEQCNADWYNAVDEYAGEILSHVLSGYRPNAIDMVIMASQAIQNYQ